MNTRRRHTPRNNQEGVYTGPSQTQTQLVQPLENPLSVPLPLAPSVDSISMSCRDRTTEFQSVCKSLQGRQNGAQGIKPVHNAVRQRSDFTLMAKRIGRDLSNTFAKLEKLTILAKRKFLFDDNAVEIDELTYIVKQDINSLNKQIAQLQELVRSRNGQNSRHLQSHSNTIVVSLQSKLASMSSDFKSVLEVRTENLKQQRSRQEQLSQSSASTSSIHDSSFSNSVLMQDSSNKADISIDMDLRSSQQMLLLNEKDRANTMQNIETTIVELGSIFQQLAQMVKEQEETVHRIDANVEDTQLNVDLAHTEILKYFQSVSNNRWLLIKIFLILIIFFFILVIFLV
ncbi:syntaxin 5A, like isoform X2 [Ictalurus furcatus]|uniref:syntaxin 5A, like isoform X2 n=1 Tax=Ictalurus furcatus TaxID=66913 RepID=UPI002350C940|nr:syntaxin 5A, like isoform X2 [Ictalurus furcatus]